MNAEWSVGRELQANIVHKNHVKLQENTKSKQQVIIKIGNYCKNYA